MVKLKGEKKWNYDATSRSLCALANTSINGCVIIEVLELQAAFVEVVSEIFSTASNHKVDWMFWAWIWRVGQVDTSDTSLQTETVCLLIIGDISLRM